MPWSLSLVPVPKLDEWPSLTTPISDRTRVANKPSRALGHILAEAMFNYTSFHDVFPTEVQLPYDRRLQHDIEAHRKNADDVLFIDRVMRALGISKGELYWIGSGAYGALFQNDLADNIAHYSQGVSPKD